MEDGFEPPGVELLERNRAERGGVAQDEDAQATLGFVTFVFDVFPALGVGDDLVRLVGVRVLEGHLEVGRPGPAVELGLRRPGQDREAVEGR